ncbi:MAG: FAD-binding oxidoreductase, partial [Myxococcaceae bacterium]|nr:FAD-binding oxidoreductase [Myxococcaceae bacterium]
MIGVAAVRAELGDIPVKDDADTRAVYGHDESDTADFLPELVVFARDTADVQRVLKACVKHGVPVTPVAGRSGKSGGSLPLEGGVSLSLERMNRIIEISAEDLTAVVEPGVILETFMKAVEEKGLFYPPDPNSQSMCTLGGNIAENAGGPRALKYGVTRDYVLGMEWVMP